MKSNFRGLVALLAKNLYPEPDVFVRELIQNAHDSIRLRTAQTPEHLGRIHLTVDTANRLITFSDDGMGMTRHVIEEFLSTIGASGTGTMTSELKREANYDVATIGQFGIGLLSAFVVAERVDVYTRHFQTDEAWHWVNMGDDEYTLNSTSEMPTIGTQVIVTVKPDFAEFLKEETLEATIRKYADLLGVPIFLNCIGPVNAVRPPWEVAAAMPATEREKYMREFLDKRYPDTPLLVIPACLPALQTEGVLYITDQQISGLNTSGFVDLYQNRMCLRPRDTELLPDWAKFVRGIVDTRSLQPTAARDNVHHNAAYAELRRALGELIMQAIIFCSEKEPAFFQQLCQWHHFHFKGMCVVNDKFFDSLALRLPFDTSEGPMNLEVYRLRLAKGEEDTTPIYYFQNDADAARFYDLCRARNIIAINAGSCFEESLLRKLMERQPGQWMLHRLDCHDSEALYQRVGLNETARFQPVVDAMTKTLDAMDLKHVHVSLRKYDPPQTCAVLLDAPRQEQADILRKLLNHPAAWSDLGALRGELVDSIDRRPQELLLNVASPIVQRLAESGRRDEATQLALRGIYFSTLLQSKGRLSQLNSNAIHKCLLDSLSQTLDLNAYVLESRQQTDALRKLVEDRNNALCSAEWIDAMKALHRQSPAEFRALITNSSNEEIAQIVIGLLTLGLVNIPTGNNGACV